MSKSNNYPAFRISILEINKSTAAREVAEHNANMGKLIEEGNYEVMSASVSDSPATLQVLLVLQRRNAN